MKLAETIHARLAAVADPARAPAMQAYMKSAMPFFGVPAGPMRQICKSIFADLRFDTAERWRAEVLAVWRGARFREERYAAVELSGLRAVRPFQRFDALPMYEEMIVTGAWWDYVDAIAAHRLLALLRNDGPEMKRTMLAWAADADLWKRRSAILCQLDAKAGTDLDLLYACIAPSITSKEFFLRKAIGWALRHCARIDPAEVVRYVEKHPELSGLSRREALKQIAG